MSNLILQALRGEDMTVYGDGSQTRSFCFVDDTVDGLVRLMASREVGPFNIGNPEERTILDAAHIVQRLTKDKRVPGASESRIAFLSLPSDDPTRRRPDITLAANVLGWQPKIRYEEGLPLTIDFFRTCL